MKLAYLTTCFGTPSHTFIRRELRRFEELGVPVALFGVRRDTTVASDSDDLVLRTRYIYPLAWPRLASLNMYFACRHPLRYFGCIALCASASGESWKNRAKLGYHLFVSVGHAKAMENEGITHLHAHFLNVASSIALFSSRLSGIPYSITIHSAGEKNLPHVIGIAMKLKHASRLIMISRFNIDYYDAIQPCREKAVTVRCGMALDEFTFDAARAPGSGPLQILAVGRFVEKKGFRYLIEAAALLKAKGSRCSITILGSGPLEDELNSLVHRLDVGDVVRLPGRASAEEVRRMMAESHCVVVPSVTSKSGEMEGIPVVVMEAMALGTPVIASAHSGIPEVVTGKTGTLVPEGDAQALADAISAFQFDSEKLARARSLIEAEFAVDKVVRQRLELFSQD